mmetsp:Transcript_9151/g.30125  ORF Transcript_9151/g.30125 Transcript_9151/m.30125 type:complete len:265 (-) Transcript_9151:820-1614(-)
MRAHALRSVLIISTSLVSSVSSSMHFITSGSARISSSSTAPLECVSIARLSEEVESGMPMWDVRKERSRLAVFASGAVFWTRRSLRPIISSRERYPMRASVSRISLATKTKKFTRSAGVPGKRARSSSRCDATPTGQLLVWQTRAMMQPVAIIAMVPNPYSSEPMRAESTTSEPLLSPPSHLSTTRSRSPFASRVLCASINPISTGPPACLIELMGDAPVPPSCPDTWITSAFALATPLLTVPMPASPTSLTLTLASGLIMCRS